MVLTHWLGIFICIFALEKLFIFQAVRIVTIGEVGSAYKIVVKKPKQKRVLSGS
jgi:hypothetical protein